MTETANPVLDQTSSLPRLGSTLACALVGLVILVAASSCGGTRHERWVTCPRPPEGADVRQFRVKGGETCGHARRVLDYAAFGHEGECSPCSYLGFMCRERPGGLERNSFGSYYTFSDDSCVHGPRRAAWRIVFHQPKTGTAPRPSPRMHEAEPSRRLYLPGRDREASEPDRCLSSQRASVKP